MSVKIPTMDRLDRPPLERRATQTELRVLPREGDGALRLTGCAVLFDVDTELVPGLIERVAPEAMGRLKSGRDVKLLLAHDTGIPLASQRNSSLSLGADRIGLHFEATLPNSDRGREVHAAVQRQDLSGVSIGFRIRKDQWSARGPVSVRTITDMDLFEISLTAVPAQEQTFVEARDLEQAQRVRHDAQVARWARQRVALLAPREERQSLALRHAALADALCIRRPAPSRGGVRIPQTW